MMMMMAGPLLFEAQHNCVLYTQLSRYTLSEQLGGGENREKSFIFGRLYTGCCCSIYLLPELGGMEGFPLSCLREEANVIRSVFRRVCLSPSLINEKMERMRFRVDV